MPVLVLVLVRLESCDRGTLVQIEWFASNDLTLHALRIMRRWQSTVDAPDASTQVRSCRNLKYGVTGNKSSPHPMQLIQALNLHFLFRISGDPLGPM